MITLPREGSVWLHKNGHMYEVIYIANLHVEADRRDDFPILVVYRRLDDGAIYARPPSLFMASRTLVE